MRDIRFCILPLLALLVMGCTDQGEPVVPENHPPQAAPDQYLVFRGETLNVAAEQAPGGVLQNDSDPDGDALIAELLSGTEGDGPFAGAVTLESDGSFVYAHDGGEADRDSFRYRAIDPAGDANEARVLVQILDACAFDIQEPEGGTELTLGDIVTIRWQSIAAGDYVMLELLRDGAVLCTLAAETDNSGEFAWTVGACEEEAGSGYRIHLLDTGAADCETFSEPFSIVDPQTVFFATDIQPIFNLNCAIAGCHVGPFAPCELDLSAGQSYLHLVGVPSNCGVLPRVVPEDPDGSELYHRVSGNAVISMPPPPSDLLAPADLELIRTWILEGAQDN